MGVARRFSSYGPGEFRDIHQLTMFADYRVPQLLRECSVWQTIKEVLAMCGGISLMLVVMAFE